MKWCEHTNLANMMFLIHRIVIIKHDLVPIIILDFTNAKISSTKVQKIIEVVFFKYFVESPDSHSELALGNGVQKPSAQSVRPGLSKINLSWDRQFGKDFKVYHSILRNAIEDI